MTGGLSYGEAVVKVLHEHTPFLAAPEVAAIVAGLVDRQVKNRHDSFEVIVDDPASASWRLKSRSEDRKRVRLACYRLNRRESDDELERTVNEALEALEDRP